MWVRKLGKRNLGIGVVLPSEALNALGWEQGDFVHIEMLTVNSLRITKFNPAQLSDRVLQTFEPEKEMSYE